MAKKKKYCELVAYEVTQGGKKANAHTFVPQGIKAKDYIHEYAKTINDVIIKDIKAGKIPEDTPEVFVDLESVKYFDVYEVL